ncbi:nuclear transport factor 2 family protein [Dactylosporangium sp. NPDC005555]|uniref:nuclear transport factor 2 family protein n=1 Tax=Dactylosporangium sp. NPDC005555 TaxID=3154889 RepID=UPI0033BC1AC6
MRPQDVFRKLVDGVAAGRWAELPELYAEWTHVVHPFDPHRAPALRSRDELREHFTPPPAGAGPRIERRATGITVHETTDPEVIVAEFAYEGTADGVPFTLPGIFVMRVRDGEIVESRDYFDHATGAAIRGGLDDLVAAVKARATAAGPG